MVVSVRAGVFAGTEGAGRLRNRAAAMIAIATAAAPSRRGPRFFQSVLGAAGVGEGSRGGFDATNTGDPGGFAGGAAPAPTLCPVFELA